MNKKLPAWLVLLIITLVAGLALGGTYALTKDAIDTQAIVAAENARKAALPAADSFTEMDLSIRSASAKGFAGPVYVELTKDAEGKIASLTIGNDAFAETPGFGLKALEESFAAQFIGKPLPVAASDIDAISGATVTTNAVIQAVNDAASAAAPQVDWCYVGEKDGQIVGYAAQVTVQGFGGPIEVIAGIDAEMNITGISVGGSNFSETAGLGAKAKDPAFTQQFVGKPAPVKVIKAGGTPADNTVDAITAATISSNAVAGAVNKIADHVEGILFPEGRGDEIVLPEKPADESLVFSASQKGFKSPIYVEAAFDASGKVTYISIGNEDFAETDGIGTMVLENEFMAQFIGKQMPLALSDIDAVSGATVSSKAVVEALNAAFNASAGIAAPAAPAEPTMPPRPAGDLSGASVRGFAGPVWVDVAFDAEGKITYLSVGDQDFAETEGFGSKAKEASFQIQFIGKQAPLALSDIDAITGATVTSEAVVNAINKAYEAATGTAEPAPTEAPADVTAFAPAANVFSADAQGFEGPVFVEITLDGNKITAIKIGDDRFDETTGLGSKVLEDAFMSQFIGKTVPMTLSDIDAVSGATITSEAVIKAINKAFEQAAPAAEAPAANVFSADAQGFEGPVFVEITLDGNKITAIKIGDDRFDETTGLGSKVLEDAFMSQFIGKTVPMTLSDIDAVSGATITSEAVIKAINKAFEQAAPAAEAPTANVFSADAQGFEGPVFVEITLDGNKITAIKIGDDRFDETTGLGSKVLEDAFMSQFIGKTVPMTLSDIDAVSGATITSEAVIKAINKAFEQAAPAAEAPAANVFSADAQGFEGPVFVEITLDGNKITAIKIGDDRFDETTGLGSKVLEDAFMSQFIGKTVPMTLSDIDAISGATITSEAVIKAINKAYEKAAPAAEAPAANVFSADAQGFEGPVFVEITLDGNKITAIKIGDDRFDETTGLGSKVLEDAFMSQFIGKTVPMTLSDIDAVSGATITSEAVIKAINKAFEQAAPAAEAPAANVFSADAQGFEGPVFVEITLDGNKITAIKIGDDRFDETTGLGSKVLEDAFMSQFIGKTVPMTLSDIDAVSGATITSEAVIKAINKAYEQSTSVK